MGASCDSVRISKGSFLVDMKSTSLPFVDVDFANVSSLWFSDGLYNVRLVGTSQPNCYK